MLEIIPSCNLVQYEGKLMMQPWAIFLNVYMGGTSVKLGFWAGIDTLGGGDLKAFL